MTGKGAPQRHKGHKDPIDLCVLCVFVVIPPDHVVRARSYTNSRSTWRMSEMARTGLSRRHFLRLTGMSAAGALLASCGAPAAQVAEPTAAGASAASSAAASSAATSSAVASSAVASATGASAAGASAAAASAEAGGGLVTPQGRTLSADAAPLDKQVFYESAGEPKHLDASRDIYGAGPVLNWGSEPLLRRDENQNIVPALAESYTVGPNAEYFDFVIREGRQVERRHSRSPPTTGSSPSAIWPTRISTIRGPGSSTISRASRR